MAGERPILYIAGDVHLRGDEPASGGFAAFLRHLAELPPARLVLLGDLFEYWLETRGSLLRYHDVLDRLRGLRRAGWHLDLVLGNRELTAGRQLAVASGCSMHWPSLTVSLGPTTVRVVHGDRICHDPAYHFFAAWMRSFWHRIWQDLHPAFLQDAVARGMRSLSRGTVRSAPARSVARPPRVFIDRRRVQACGRGVDALVAGHIHQSWRRTIGGVDVLLVGDWPGGRGHWIEGFSDGRLERVARDFSTSAAPA
jgi:UDP-2,3-diacylglucosamine pyrophosphatase LpxH